MELAGASLPNSLGYRVPAHLHVGASSGDGAGAVSLKVRPKSGCEELYVLDVDVDRADAWERRRRTVAAYRWLLARQIDVGIICLRVPEADVEELRIQLEQAGDPVPLLTS